MEQFNDSLVEDAPDGEMSTLSLGSRSSASDSPLHNSRQDKSWGDDSLALFTPVSLSPISSTSCLGDDNKTSENTPAVQCKSLDPSERSSQIPSVKRSSVGEPVVLRNAGSGVRSRATSRIDTGLKKNTTLRTAKTSITTNVRTPVKSLFQPGIKTPTKGKLNFVKTVPIPSRSTVSTPTNQHDVIRSKSTNNIGKDISRVSSLATLPRGPVNRKPSLSHIKSKLQTRTTPKSALNQKVSSTALTSKAKVSTLRSTPSGQNSKMISSSPKVGTAAISKVHTRLRKSPSVSCITPNVRRNVSVGTRFSKRMDNESSFVKLSSLSNKADIGSRRSPSVLNVSSVEKINKTEDRYSQRCNKAMAPATLFATHVQVNDPEKAEDKKAPVISEVLTNSNVSTDPLQPLRCPSAKAASLHSIIRQIICSPSVTASITNLEPLIHPFTGVEINKLNPMCEPLRESECEFLPEIALEIMPKRTPLTNSASMIPAPTETKCHAVVSQDDSLCSYNAENKNRANHGQFTVNQQTGSPRRLTSPGFFSSNGYQGIYRTDPRQLFNNFNVSREYQPVFPDNEIHTNLQITQDHLAFRNAQHSPINRIISGPPNVHGAAYYYKAPYNHPSKNLPSQSHVFVRTKSENISLRGSSGADFQRLTEEFLPGPWRPKSTMRAPTRLFLE